jgi:nitrile hydratase accessory protein
MSGEAPPFQEPWQAEAFALAVKLHEAGLFTWTEWAEALAAEIRRAQASGDPDLGNTYYDHWLAALERLVQAKGMLTADALRERRDAWDRAVRATPHGKPIEL